jgi:uncharacterized protein
MLAPDQEAWLRLVVLQPSPFCNINCDYCYLPDRARTHRMSTETLHRAISELFSSDLISDQVTFVWHAGEPLAVPIRWYEEAFSLIRDAAPPGLTPIHTFQSNGTLINEHWCEFFNRWNAHLGLSIDGPEFLHDIHRKTRKGAGTHAQAMRGARFLRESGRDFHVIAVVSRESLDHADAIFDFFLENEIYRFGFNIDEMEGANESSSLTGVPSDRIEAFFRRMFERQKAERGRVNIREFDSALHRIMRGRSDEAERFVYENEQVRPFGILSIDWQGNFSTYSPELLGLTLGDYGEFSFGSVHQTPLGDAVQTPKFQRVLADIQAGVERCRAECAYFNLCGGGAPANKFFENGSFTSSATQYCRYAVKVPINLVLQDLEKSLGHAQPPTAF